jgi:hypothetical protein
MLHAECFDPAMDGILDFGAPETGRIRPVPGGDGRRHEQSLRVGTGLRHAIQCMTVHCGKCFLSASDSSVMMEIVRIGGDRDPRQVSYDPPGVHSLPQMKVCLIWSTLTVGGGHMNCHRMCAQREISSPPERWSFGRWICGRGPGFLARQGDGL